jgi:hypothetical protein
VVVMILSRVRVMRSGLVITGFVEPCCFAMVLGGVLVMLRGLVVVLCGLLRHACLLLPLTVLNDLDLRAEKLAGGC